MQSAELDGKDMTYDKDKAKEYARKYYQENKGKINERVRKYYQENKDKINERVRKYRQENKDEINEQKRKYYQENKDEINEYQRKYRQKNNDKVEEYRRKYRQKNKDKINERGKKQLLKIASKITLDANTIRQIYSAWSGVIAQRDQVCQVCGSREKLEAHHILPKALYPNLSFNPNNGVLLCVNCHDQTEGKNLVEAMAHMRRH